MKKTDIYRKMRNHKKQTYRDTSDRSYSPTAFDPEEDLHVNSNEDPDDDPDEDPYEEPFEEESVPIEIGSAYSLESAPRADENERLQAAIKNAMSGMMTSQTGTDQTALTFKPRELEEILASAPVKYAPEVIAYLKKTSAMLPVLRQMDCLPVLWSENLLISVDDDCGLSEILAALHEVYVAQEAAAPTDYDSACAELSVPYVEEEEQRYAGWDLILKNLATLQNYVQQGQASCSIITLDISAWMDELNSPEVKSYLQEINKLTSDCLLVFRIPFVERQHLLEAYINLSDIMGIKALYVPPLCMADMVDYIKETLESWELQVEPDCLPAIESYILQEKEDNSFFGYDTLDKMSDLIMLKAADLNIGREKPSMTISPAVVQSFLQPRDQVHSAKEQLQMLVGAARAKEQIPEIISDIKSGKAPLHMLFTGNPGTGKSKVARLLSGLLKEEGLLSRGQVYEIKGDSLLGGYPGQTGPRTSAICRDALGSVLFIDEISSLFTENGENDADYAREAVDALLCEMQIYQDLCVVIAGSSKEIRQLLRRYPELEAVFPHQIELENFSREELTQIFFTLVSDDFLYEEGFQKAVEDYFSSLPEDFLQSESFSNARFVRNLFESLWGKASCRSALYGKEKITLLKSDLEAAGRVIPMPEPWQDICTAYQVVFLC